MPIESITPPNPRLQEERLRRAWSQRELADLLGTTHNNVSRWERGITEPGPYFRQKLRDVFALSDLQLGLKPAEREAPAGAARKPRAIVDPLIPLPRAPSLVGRAGILTDLKQRLLLASAGANTAINGSPGAGKTEVAIALTNDPDVRAHFSDGILWAGLGTEPHPLGLLSRWGTLLGVPGEREKTLAEWAMALRMAIGSRSMLLVIDDAWTIEAALAFKVGGPNCASLLTSRFTDLALQFVCGRSVIRVRELSEEQGIALLAQLAPEAVAREPSAVCELVRTVAGNPLALSLIGHYLDRQAAGGKMRRIRNAIEHLHKAAPRFSLSQNLACLDQSPALAEQASVSLYSSIATSVERVSRQAQAALRSLAIFPAKPNSFSEEAALAVSAVPAKVLDELSNAGLLDICGEERYAMHQTIHDFSKLRRDTFTHAVKQRFATYFAGFVEAHKTDYPALEVENINMHAAVQVATEKVFSPLYTRMVTAFAYYLNIKGMYAFAEQHLQHALSCHEMSPDARSELLLLLGIIAKKYGKLGEAEHFHRRGLDCAVRSDHCHLEVKHLSRLGFLFALRQKYEQARSTFHSALDKACAIDDPFETCTIFNGLAMVYRETANYAAALRYIEEGIELARKYGLIEREVTLLTNWSSIASLQKNTAEAEQLAQRALAMAQAHALHESLVYLYNALADLAMDRENYQQAIDHSTHCLSLASHSGHLELIGGSLCTLGIAYGQKGDFPRAHTYFQQALQVVSRADFPLLRQEIQLRYADVYLLAGTAEQAAELFRELVGVEEADIRAGALFGLARVFTFQGDAPNARKYARQCLALAQEIGHEVVQIRRWLDLHDLTPF